MAIEASKSKNLSSQYNNAYVSKGTITAYFKENSSSIDRNTSNIYVKASIYTPSASWTNTNGVSDHLRIYWHDNKDNSDVLKATWSGTSVGVGATITAEATFDVEHNSDGKLSGYAWAVWSRDGNNGYSPYSTDVATDWTALTSIPRAATITTAPNFNDTDSPVLKYSNPAGTAVSSLQACIANTAGDTAYAAYRDISKTGTSYTFNLTTAERNALRAATPNSNTLKVKYYVKTVIGSNTYYKSSEATLSIVEANPTFSAFTYRDTNTAVTDITGNDQYLVQGKSTLRATVPAANKASATKSATMSSYAASISGLSATGNYSASADVNMDFSSNAFTAGSQALTVKAIDSRGNSTSVTKNVTVLAYSAPVINASATRLNNFENDTTLVIKGSYSPLTIDSAAKNTVTSVQYRYKKQSSTAWGAWTDMPGLSVSAAGTYTTTNKVLDLSNTDAWDIQVRTIDRFSTTTASVTVSVGIPTMRIGSDGFVYNQEQRVLTVKDMPFGTADIENGAITPEKLDLSSSIGSNYLYLGDILICFGTFSVSGVGTGAYGEKNVNVTFPKDFAEVPVVTVSVGDFGNVCGEYIAINPTKTNFTAFIGHTASTSSTSASARYIAIGKRAD